MIFFCSLGAQAQVAEDAEAMQDLIPEKPCSSTHYIAHDRNPLKAVAGTFFLLYKDLFSSQDGNSCQFHPSCSEYAIDAVRQNGLLVGILAAFDRLTRCNKLSPEKYEPYTAPDGRKLRYDPVL